MVFVLGLGAGWGIQFIGRSHAPTEVEVALAQVAYNDLKVYGTKDYRLGTVLQVVDELGNQRWAELPPKQVYAPLEALAAQQTEEEALANLQQGEAFLRELEVQPGIFSVVEHFVYVQTLHEGDGEAVTTQDTIEIEFKEYDLDGTLLKDSAAPVTIPISQTIKGVQCGLKGMRIGESRKIFIHPEYGFGKVHSAGSNRLLIYEVTLLAKK